MTSLSRLFIAASLATGSVSATAGPGHKDFFSASPAGQAHHVAAAKALAKAIGKGGQTIFVGDSNHQAHALDFLAEDTTLDALRDAGVGDIMLELPDNIEPIAQDYAADKITEAQFDQRLLDKGYDADFMYDEHHATAHLITGAAQRGMTVHFVDAQLADPVKIDAFERNHDEANEAFAKIDQKAAQDADRAGLNAIAAEAGRDHLNTPVRKSQLDLVRQLSPLLTAATPEIAAWQGVLRRNMEFRLKQDFAVAKDIRDKTTHGKTLVFYGDIHAWYPCALADRLGAATVNLHQNSAELYKGSQYRFMYGGRTPDYAIVIDEGRLFGKAEIDASLIRAGVHVTPKQLQPSLCQAVP